MSHYHNLSMDQVVSQLDILLPGEKPFFALSAVIQARQRLGSDVMETVFNHTQRFWYSKTPHPDWHGLTHHAVDNVAWRTPDTKNNIERFGRTANETSISDYPQVRMARHMELTSHLLSSASFDSVTKSEIGLTAPLLERSPSNSLTIWTAAFTL